MFAHCLLLSTGGVRAQGAKRDVMQGFTVRALSHSWDSWGASVNALGRSKQCPQSASCGAKTN